MIHYHGGPVWPQPAAVQLWTRRHGLTSFAHPEQVALMAEMCQSFILDNGAFTLWTDGKGEVDVAAYAAWVRVWERHPGFDWCLIPDVIDGTEADNERMLSLWADAGMRHGVPVWHLHESLERLAALVEVYPRIALGSSGQWSTVGDESWWRRMGEVRPVVTDDAGRPLVKLHGLRMLSPAIFGRIPLSSADSCNVARNIPIDKKWGGPYPPVTEGQRALVLAERIELAPAATHWPRGNEQLDMLGMFSLTG